MKTIKLTDDEAGYLYTVLGYRFIDLEQSNNEPKWYDQEETMCFNLRIKIWNEMTKRRKLKLF